MRLLDWIVDYAHLLKGSASMYRHRHPPRHYLGYIVPGQAPIILIPGVRGRWAFLKPLGDYLSLLGHPVYIVPELGNNLADIPTTAAKVRAVINEAGLKDVILVGHSKGGLVGKYLLQFHNQDNRIKGLVSLGTPYSGTSLVKLFPHPAYREMLPNSEIIRKLQGYREVNRSIISIAPVFDNHVWSEAGSFLEGAWDNIKVPVYGHHKLVFDKNVWEKIAESIDRFAKT